MREDTVPVVIIGGGVIGLAIAVRLAKKLGPESVYVLEKNAYLGEEQSGRNSGVIHSGIYYEPGSLKARLCVPGNEMLKEFCREHSIPHARMGKLVVSVSPEDDETLEFYLRRAYENGVPNVSLLLSADAITLFEPNVCGRKALFIPSSGVVDVASYIKKLEQLAVHHGAQIVRNAEVVGIENKNGHIELSVRQGPETYTVNTDRVVNAAGLHGDKIARMINPGSPYAIQPLKGEYCTFNMRNRPGLSLSGMNVYTTPKYAVRDGNRYFSVGIHLTPTFELTAGDCKDIGSTVLVGPTADPIDDPADYKSRLHDREHFLEAIRPILPELRAEDLQLSYAGIRAKMRTPKDDFVLTADSACDTVFHALADSPGLTSSLAIAEYIDKNFF